MKIKSIFVILVVNIALMLIVTVFQEYANMGSTFRKLDMTFDLAVDMAVSSSMSSEEFFSDEFNDTILSTTRGNFDENKLLYSKLQYMRGGVWISGNSYVLAMYYAENGGLPTSQYEYDIYENLHGKTEDIYEFLFGGVGSDYYDSELRWANSDDGGVHVSTINSRVPNSDFKVFYNTVGKQILSTQYVKEKVVLPDGSISWNIKEMTLPVLAQMGLKLSSYNNVSSSVTSDNLTSVTHLGRLKNGSLEYSEYYLTPYSLGVTYIPVSVLKTVLRTNLENLIRFQKCKSVVTDSDDTTSDAMTAYSNADGCIYDTKYTGGDTWTSGDLHTHRMDKSAEIYNDGDIEYDLSTLQVKVDYFVVDFYDNNNWKIVNEVEGATPYDASLLETLPSRLKNTDTSEVVTSDSGKRVVAKVDAKVKVHIPYKAFILQWFIERTSTRGTEHFDMKGYDEATNSIVSDEDGLWYTYTKYVAISR